jgi:hypothetical protein
MDIEVIDVAALKKQNAALRKLFDAVENVVKARGGAKEDALALLGETYYEVKNAGLVSKTKTHAQGNHREAHG